MSLLPGTQGMILTGKIWQCDENGVRRRWSELIYMGETKWAAHYYLLCSTVAGQ